ncbi:uncharacterized protein LOC118505923 isoform X1 [Anopheles stephensi]|uniref:uncharacterized protein LOC118505923 isoform X1 n=1 Tax=Anopheles stephensi TaxID=30069 RepID=UPI0016588D88|nr:uncharacterized protein LOC118505923 isoform X1 [Anopheles stephensi]
MEDQASTSGHDAGSVGVSEVTPEKKGPSKKPTKGGHEADSVGQKNLSKKKLSFRVTTPTRRVTRSAKKAHGNVKKQTVQVAVSSSESDSSSEEEEEVEPTSVDVQPTKEQRRARHGISQKLPEFNGKPQDWPRFYGAFLASNKSCGFTNNENLVRLQECLKGPALELVRGRLITAESVPRVIEKLVQVYGRPELILHSLLKKVREVKAPKASDLTSFLPFSNAVEELCEHLEAAQLKDHLHNPLLIQELVDKLPDADKRAWSRFKRGHGSVSLRTLTDFLDEVVTEVLDTTLDLGNYMPLSSQPKDTRRRETVGHHQTTPAQQGRKPCLACEATDHRLRNCTVFKEWTTRQRQDFVAKYSLCRLCLNGHQGRCFAPKRCNVGDCDQMHHPLLHDQVGSKLVDGISAHVNANDCMLFRVVPVNVHHNGTILTVLCFLDEGASITLVERQLVERLGAGGVPEKLTLRWTAGIERVEDKSQRLNLTISSVGSAKQETLKDARTVERLELPHQSVDREKLKERYAHLRKIPIESYQGRPEIMVGLNNIHLFTPLEVVSGEESDPIAVKTKLGWSVYGYTKSGATKNNIGYHSVTNEDLDLLIREHYKLEESVITIPNDSAENKRAKELLEETTKRVGERFETGLLWKENERSFPESYSMAVRRFKQLETKLKKTPELHNNLCQQIEEYQRKGYAHRITPEELRDTPSKNVWYLPINVVVNPKKPGKVRVVWDAAATVKGVSLNTELLKGPDLLVPLMQVITGFREKRIAFGGDLREMFHQIQIRSEDKQSQRFVFRKSPNEPFGIYVMDVATFGATCSPCTAQFVKNRNACEYQDQFPQAAEAIIKRHYVDDYFDSTDTVEKALKLAKEVTLVHRKGGFEIRNWVSNSKEFLEQLGENTDVGPIHFNKDKETLHERVLGVIWDPTEDMLSFSTSMRDSLRPYVEDGVTPTKRIVTSCVMGLYDPLGLISPFTIHGKILIQHLWRSKCDWDDEINKEAVILWHRWIELLENIKTIRIPRCYLDTTHSDAIESVELHVFTDASEHAYGCVAYLRIQAEGTVRCKLVMSRSKVAPLKRQTIPRLELMAAVLGARISHTILETHSLKIDKCTFWSDSKTVLSWINSEQHRFVQFVAFRIGEIWELTNKKDWRWVPTKLNIADVMTKWGKGPPLEMYGEWFSGPAFLYEPEEHWPVADGEIESTEEDTRKIVLFHSVITSQQLPTWQRLVRVMAYVIRFVDNCVRKRDKQAIHTIEATGKLSTNLKATFKARKVPIEKEELERAEIHLIRQSQWESFPEEMDILHANLDSSVVARKIKKKSVVYKYSPVLDENGVMRMESRLINNRDLPFDQRYPIILARQHEITKRIVQHYHESFGHANSETVLNEMRQRFKIPKHRAAIKEVRRQCTWCRVYKCKPFTPRMAPLPVERSTPSFRPFSAVGIDYLGPLEVTVGRRKEKRWVAVFTCLTIRAVHLEVVHTLSTQSCLMAIRRFESKFGKADDIFSDNATCFRGADNELQRIDRIFYECAEKVISASTSWHFTPPGTPHMGGVWERMVRSVKEAMRVLGDNRVLTDEILLTTLAEACEMINSRPLTYLPEDSLEPKSLTPNQFLRAPGSCTAVCKSYSLTESLRNQFKRSQYLADRMWERWTKEYLSSINQRSKWFEDQKELKIGDLVFVVDGKNRAEWLRGRVVETIKGKDNRVRQADVKLANNKIIRRAVIHLAALEIQ